MSPSSTPKQLLRLQKPIKHSVTVPGSKSYANRALLCAALASGRTTLTNINLCDDVRYFITALKKFGIRIEVIENVASVHVVIYGTGGQLTEQSGIEKHALQKKTSHKTIAQRRAPNPQSKIINIGNAGTAARFLTPFLPVNTLLTGNLYMQKRPLHDLLNALRKIGFDIESATGCPPVRMMDRHQSSSHITIQGSVSSQYVSALLMLAPTLPHGLTISVRGALVSKPYVDMTIEVMKQFGIKIQRTGYKKFVVAHQRYHSPSQLTNHSPKNQSYAVPPDASSATYWWSLAAITGSHITVNTLQDFTQQPDVQFLRLLKRMGCTVQGSTVTGPTELKPINANLNAFPDSAMSLAIVAACAPGKSMIRGVAHLQVKETNRLTLLVRNLKAVGIRVVATQDALTIYGNLAALHTKAQRPINITTEHDHRFAMAFAILGLRTGNISIDHPTCVRKSYPEFWQTLTAIQKQAKQQTIVLTGMRGSGKTTLGKQWAEQYQARYIDFDMEIEKMVGMSLYDYITQYGMKKFRATEHVVTKKFSGLQNAIIATGGGTLTFPRNQRLLRQQYIILLTAPVQELRKRIRRDTVQGKERPPLHSHSTSSAVQEIGLIWRQRKPIYLNIADRIYDSRHSR